MFYSTKHDRSHVNWCVGCSQTALTSKRQRYPDYTAVVWKILIFIAFWVQVASSLDTRPCWSLRPEIPQDTESARQSKRSAELLIYVTLSPASSWIFILVPFIDFVCVCQIKEKKSRKTELNVLPPYIYVSFRQHGRQSGINHSQAAKYRQTSTIIRVNK